MSIPIQEKLSPLDYACPLYRSCRICNKIKNYNWFIHATERGRIKLRNYCYDCEEIMQQQNQPIDLGIQGLDPAVEFIELYGPKRKWKCPISYEQAIKYVSEGAARVISTHRIVKKYDDKELRQFILERDKGICYFCGENAQGVYKLVSKSGGGIRSPKNCVCACEACNRSVSNNHRHRGSVKFALPVHNQYGEICTTIENPDNILISYYKDTETISVYCDYSLHPDKTHGGYAVIVVGCKHIMAFTHRNHQSFPITHEEELKGLLKAMDSFSWFLQHLQGSSAKKVVFYTDVGNISDVLKGKINRYVNIATKINLGLKKLIGNHPSTRFEIHNIKASRDRSYYRLAHRFARKAIGIQ